jgi:hypothetical protein
MKIENPLYVNRKTTSDSKEKNVATARIDNALPGVCPKCQTTMATSQLGQCMGNQEVFFCTTCRVASPIPTTAV